MNKYRFRFFAVLLVLLSYTCIKAIQLAPGQPWLASFMALLLFMVMLSSMFVYRASPEVFDRPWFRVLTWTGSITMGLWATFILISIPFDFIHLLVWSLVKLKLNIGLDAENLSLIFRVIYLAVFASSLGIVLLGFFEVLRGPKIVPVQVAIKDLPPSLQHLKIAQISDLHVGPTIRKKYVEEVVRRTNACGPDLVVFTGDIADAHASSIVEHLKPLKNIKARYGCYYVTGNHEYYWNAQLILDQIKQLGFTILINQNALIKHGDCKIMVAGVTDPVGGHMMAGHKTNMVQAISSSHETQFKILLAHRPDSCLEAEGLGFDLQFSGHTHAGQFFPFSLLIGLEHKYSRGLYQHGNMWVYVNPGTGYWGPAHRLGVRSEISLIELIAQRPG